MTEISFDKPSTGLGTPQIGASGRDSVIQFIAAVLLISVARADHDYDELEFHRVLRLIERHFGLDAQSAAELVNDAEDRTERVVSAADYGQFLERRLDQLEKETIITLLWKVAFADGLLHPYECSFVFRISELLNIERTRALQLRLDAAPRTEPYTAWAKYGSDIGSRDRRSSLAFNC